MSTTDGFTPFDHVTEREPGPWRDCTFASLLEVCRAGFPDGASIPPTVAEKEALRAAVGLPDDHTGASIAQAIEAARIRYNLGGGYRVTSDWNVVLTALQDPESRCIVQGSMGSVPASLRRWSPNFSGPHAVASRGRTWCDPLAPKGDYTGEFITLGTWESYWRGLPGAQALITAVGALTREENPQMLKVTDPTPRTVDLAVGVQLLDLNGQPFARNAVARNDIPSPFLTGTFRAVIVNLAAGAALLLVRAQDATDAKPIGDVKHRVTLQVDGQPVSTTEV